MNLEAMRTAINAWRPEAVLFGAKQKEWKEALDKNDEELKALNTMIAVRDKEINDLEHSLNETVGGLMAICAKFFPDSQLDNWENPEQFAKIVGEQFDAAIQENTRLQEELIDLRAATSEPAEPGEDLTSSE